MNVVLENKLPQKDVPVGLDEVVVSIFNRINSKYSIAFRATRNMRDATTNIVAGG